MNIYEINKARVIYYGLFSSLFSYFENEEDYKKIVYTIKFLSQVPFDETSKEIFENISEYLKQDKAFESLQEENNNIFYSPSTSFVPVTASYYAEQRDDGQKRIEMSNIVLKSDFRKDTKVFKEAEDHISFIFAFLKKTIEQNETEILDENVLSVYNKILNDVIDEFITKLYEHENSEFYKNIAVLLKIFIEVERTLLSIEKNQKQEKRAEHELFHKKKKAFKKKIKRNFDEVTSL